MAETTLATLTQTGTFPTPALSFGADAYAAINASITAQNANNTSLRTGINACATTPVPSSQLDPTTVQYLSLPITLVQLLALNATPLVVLAAPGSGKLIEVLDAVIEYVYGSAAFTIGSATNLTLNYGATGTGAAITVSRAATGFFDQTATQVSILKVLTTNVSGAATGVVNAAVALVMAGADMTVGTGATGILKLAYRVHSGL